MAKSVSEIFAERPHWDLRGDPYLWDDLEKHFSNFTIPFSEDEFIQEMVSAFEKLTGDSILADKYIHIPAYDHGGISSGSISPEFWHNEMLPLLIKRLRLLNQEK